MNTFFKSSFSLLLLIILFCCFACNKPDQNTEIYSSNLERPNNPWVFRSVLDSIPRVVTFALNTNMWVAYSAENGAMYKAWQGSVNFDGPVYNTNHGPQPTSIGDAWIDNKYSSPWRVLKGDKEIEPKDIQYKGHRYQGEHAHLIFDLTLEDGTKVTITEQPEYVTSSTGGAGLERVFKTSNVPAGVKIAMKANISSVAFENSIRVEGGAFNIHNKKERNEKGLFSMDIDGTLVLASNGITTLTTYFVKTPMIDHPKKKILVTADEETDAGYILIAKNDCKTCHNTIRQTIGPAYMDVAKLYANTSDNVKTLVNKVKNGGSGNWGQTAMNAHPNISDEDITTMVDYIMSLDAEEEAKQAAVEIKTMALSPSNVVAEDLNPGILSKFYQSSKDVGLLADFNWGAPKYESILGTIGMQKAQVKWTEGNFAFRFEGYWKIDKKGEYNVRLLSDDGSKLWLNDKLILDNDGPHGTQGPEILLQLDAGFYKIQTDYFQGLGGMALILETKSKNGKKYEPIDVDNMFHHKENQKRNESIANMPINATAIPGDGFPLNAVHPSFNLSQARPNEFTPKVGGMDFLSDGRMVISTWDPAGSVYILDNVDQGDPGKITTKLIGSGLAEPLGLKIVDDEIYVLQKQELTKLIDHDGDEIIDEYQTVSNDWKVSSNFHEFAFGLAYKEEKGKGYFYGTLATAIEAGGASSSPQIPDRGKVVKISKEDGKRTFLGHGLRTPNGINAVKVGKGKDAVEEIFVADNQGDWLPSSKIVHVSASSYDWFGSRSVDPVGTATMKEKQPVVWLPQDEIGNSPSQMIGIDNGPYAGQMLHGEVTHGGLKRVFIEKINGLYQGALFRFTQGLEAGINRVCKSPDGSLYVGGIGSTGNWGHEGGLYYGLQRLQFNDNSTFEMLAVRAKSNGIEIEFTEELREGDGWNVEDYDVKRWWYKPTPEYGGPKMDETKLNVLSASVSKDRKKVFLEIDGLKENHVVYLRLKNHFVSVRNHSIWSTECWYTMNHIPQNQLGKVIPRPADYAVNKLTPSEKKDGWQLLFDGNDIGKNWHLFTKPNETGGWSVDEGAMFFNPALGKGGDIVSDKQFQNFILELEWKIQDCGNSGIFFNVVEDPKYYATYLTGVEMQVLDNTCHYDARFPTHRAADLYDMLSCKFETVKPAGEWNKVRLKIENGKVEHWLNGHLLVEYEMWTEAWNTMIANSKFSIQKDKNFKDFGKAKKGHLALQDHGDKVWYRNIKIKEIK
jgi:cytochrome c